MQNISWPSGQHNNREHPLGTMLSTIPSMIILITPETQRIHFHGDGVLFSRLSAARTAAVKPPGSL